MRFLKCGYRPSSLLDSREDSSGTLCFVLIEQWTDSLSLCLDSTRYLGVYKL